MITLGTLGETIKGSRNFSAATLSADQGKTWTPFVECNMHYSIPYVAQSGRIYSISPIQFTYSDDEGKTWSEPFNLGLFEFSEHSAWSVCLPKEVDGVFYLAFAKINLPHPPRRTEVFLLASDNLSHASDPRDIRWRLLPNSDNGLRGPDWHQPEHRTEEPHLQILNDGTFYLVFRTDQGYIGCTTSKDKGASWSPPRKLVYAQTGRTIKHPLACPSFWKCENGKYLLFIHNHGKRFTGCPLSEAYAERNPAWICGGIEKDGNIQWSQPDVLLYSDDLSYHSGRISYPGFLEDHGRYHIFETDKVCARSHLLDQQLLEGQWNQLKSVPFKPKGGIVPERSEAVVLPSFNHPKKGSSLRVGISFTFDLRLPEHDVGACTLLSNRGSGESGLELCLDNDRRLKIELADRQTINRWRSDSGLLKEERNNRVTVIIDGGPRIIVFVINGILNDGGEDRQFGWGRFSPQLTHINTGHSFRMDKRYMSNLIIIPNAITISQAVFHANDPIP